VTPEEEREKDYALRVVVAAQLTLREYHPDKGLLAVLYDQKRTGWYEGLDRADVLDLCHRALDAGERVAHPEKEIAT
jgi:hypothetical protein